MSSNNTATPLQRRDKHDTLSHIDEQHDVLESDLVELERKLIPLLNRTRAMLGKPPIIAPKGDDAAADGEHAKYHEFGTEEFRRKYSK